MKILLTGANGYIGKRLLPALLKEGHEVICCVRDKSRFSPENSDSQRLTIIEVNFIHEESLHAIPSNIDGAYFLIYSRSFSSQNIFELCDKASRNFINYMESIQVKHVVYLSDLTRDKNLSEFQDSITNVERILTNSSINVTILRAGIIIGSGSASFEIIRNLVEKSPLMIGPKWLSSNCQPVAIRDVITYLTRSIFNDKTYNQYFDIGGPELMSFRETLRQFARARNLKRVIITLPVKVPRLSSYWLFLICSASYDLARNFIDNLIAGVSWKKNELKDLIDIKPRTYFEAIQLAFNRIEQNYVLSSWKDAVNVGPLNADLSQYIQVPRYGCFRFVKVVKVNDPEIVLENIWSIGGGNGWYYANWLWKIRGFIDKMFGGVGLKRGRTNPHSINTGDALDFWRVILADKPKKRMLLYAEMKLPGEGWLELKIDNENNFHQIATFRPRGIWGRVYWYSVLPFHILVFNGMVRSIKQTTLP
jgi:uncharacterized protein YbjT (DUF2867 family)